MKYISIYEISSKIDIEHNTQYKWSENPNNDIKALSLT
jgi:hypothetical protein